MCAEPETSAIEGLSPRFVALWPIQFRRRTIVVLEFRCARDGRLVNAVLLSNSCVGELICAADEEPYLPPGPRFVFSTRPHGRIGSCNHAQCNLQHITDTCRPKSIVEGANRNTMASGWELLTPSNDPCTGDKPVIPQVPSVLGSIQSPNLPLSPSLMSWLSGTNMGV